jgi:metal-sulfur cluster biosynthetic enzyme
MTQRPVDTESTLHAAVWRALDDVLDPELDEPITGLGFVASCYVGPDGTVTVRLRVPTYYCAPNFVFMMVADAREAVARVPGVSSVSVGVADHFAADDINDGVAEQRTFVETFGDLAVSDLDRLRRDFLRKAVLAATDRVCEPLVRAGLGTTQLATLTLEELSDDATMRRLRERRGQLGLPIDGRAPLLVDPATGAKVTDDQVATYLRRARLTRISTETNGELCRGLLHNRYAGTPVNIRNGGPHAEDAP